MRATLIIGCVLLLNVSGDAAAETPAPCQVHVILFVPSGVRPPTEYQRRVDEIVGYTEAFLKRELARWGHEGAAMPFRRSAEGHVEVTMMRGRRETTEYKPVTVRAEVMDELRGLGKMEGGRQVWWIMVYAGDPPERFDGFLGGFGERIGGWSVCNFDTTAGRIDPDARLGSEFPSKLMLKGMLHELGHAFGLPHVGPLDRDNAGNTLMGPTHFNYRRVRGAGEERVYLSEAEAAMLSLNPAFRGVADVRGPLPEVEVESMRYAADTVGKTIVVRGKVRSTERAVYALVADESDARPGEYWTKTYVGEVAPDGAFEVVVREPSESSGTLRTWFAFESGAQTGDGEVRGKAGGIPKSYRYSRDQWAFD